MNANVLAQVPSPFLFVKPGMSAPFGALGPDPILLHATTFGTQVQLPAATDWFYDPTYFRHVMLVYQGFRSADVFDGGPFIFDNYNNAAGGGPLGGLRVPLAGIGKTQAYHAVGDSPPPSSLDLNASWQLEEIWPGDTRLSAVSFAFQWSNDLRTGAPNPMGPNLAPLVIEDDPGLAPSYVYSAATSTYPVQAGTYVFRPHVTVNAQLSWAFHTSPRPEFPNNFAFNVGNEFTRVDNLVLADDLYFSSEFASVNDPSFELYFFAPPQHEVAFYSPFAAGTICLENPREALRLPNLRQRQRDDAIRVSRQPRNGPTSRQANALRRGPRNNYR